MQRQIAVLSIVAGIFTLSSAGFAGPPVLEVSPTYLEFSAYEDGNNPENQILSIWRGGGNGPLDWEVIEDCNWLQVNPTSGKSMGEVDDVNVIVDISGMGAGLYNRQLTVDAGGAVNSPQVVDVNLVIYQPVIELSAMTFEFAALKGGANPADQILGISNSGTGTLNWEITEDCAWLSAEPNSGSSTGEVDDVNLSVDITGLARGTYDCNLIISGLYAANSPQIVGVDLVIYQPVIELSTTTFEFMAFEGGANPADQMLSISNSGGGTLNWEITEDCNWLVVEPNNGSSTGEIDDVNLSVDISGLVGGIYDCNVTISDPNASNSPQTVMVRLLVGVVGELYVPSEYPTIQYAIDVALDGAEVIVAPGTYTGDGNRDLDFGGKAITVRSSDPEDPGVVAATVIDCENISGHRGFYFHSGEDTNSVVSGLTITNGYADEGSGIYLDGSGATIRNCRIIGNATGVVGVSGGNGGGICSYGSSLRISSSTISQNITAGGIEDEYFNSGDGGNGGGVYCDVSSSLEVSDCTITDNVTGNGNETAVGSGGVGGSGGGVYCYSAIIEGSTLSGNAAGKGGAQYMSGKNGGHGGGIYCTTGLITLSNCTFSQNKAGNGGGSLHMNGSGGPGGDGGGICCKSCSQVTVEDCIFANNLAGDAGYGNLGGSVGGDGGGIYCESCSTVTIDYSSLTDNSAGDGFDDDGGRGGGIYCESASISNCIITGNTTGDGGYKAPPGEGFDGGDGAGIFCTSATITNCTITGNNTGEGHSGSPAGVRGQGGGIYATSGTVVSDSIVWYNSPEQMVGQDCNNVSYSDIGDATCSSGTGNIDADPCFVTGPLGDYYLSQIAAGQAVDSPCVDAGSNTAVNLGMDIYTTRIDKVWDEGIVDMGYHYSGNLADLNDSGHVDLGDFAILASQWQDAPGVPTADIAPEGGDGIVDVKDLAVLCENYLW